MDHVRDALDQPAQELRGDPARRLRMDFGEGELGDTVDGDEHIPTALARQHLRQIDVDVPEWVGLERPPGVRPIRHGQPADGMALEQACSDDRVSGGIVACKA